MIRSAEELRQQFNDEHLRTLNQLVAAVERLSAPDPVDVPAWSGDADQDWPALAAQLHDLLEEATGPDHDVSSLVEGLQGLASDARHALIALGVYDPPVGGQ